MESAVVCPKCGEIDSLEVFFDAWARYKVIGVDGMGNLLLEAEPTIQEFDDNHVECVKCGETLSKDRAKEFVKVIL